ncbi:MAG: thioredoxin-disulfide reductase [Planctomycetes bacterium]|nr:thioredoxin-disulfide reductase [Planctomycetota bacterium]
MVRNVIIIGSGPAGYTAAIYASRANLQPLLFAGEPPAHLDGGQLMLTTDVENYPGFPEGITGPEMMDKFLAQSKRFGTEVQMRSVTKVDLESRPFRVFLGEEVHESKTIIIATGAEAKWLNLPGEKELHNRGISACATCDGALFGGKVVGVVGGGDSAVEEATFLTRFASKVHMIHRRDQLRASKIMQDRALSNPKIAMEWNTIPEGYSAKEGKHGPSLAGVKVRDTNTGETREIPMDGFFMAIGHKPNTDLFTGVLDMDEVGYLKTKPGTTYTNIEGVFACGDVQDRHYRQAVTAAGTGCMAAIDAERWIETQH